MSRLEALHALAWSLPDVQPAPTGDAGMKGAIRGEVPGAWRLCDTCDGDRVVRDKFGRASTCPACGGAGRFRVDPFTGERVAGVGSTAPPRGRHASCGGCGGSGVMRPTHDGRLIQSSPNIRDARLVRCTVCDGAGSVLVPFDADQGEASSVVFDGSALSRARARGDWDALEAALTALAGVDRGRHRRWVAVRVVGDRPVSPGQAADLVSTDRALLAALPDPLRCPRDVRVAFAARLERGERWVAERQVRVVAASRKARRDRAREMLLAGAGPREAAKSSGVSLRTAQRVARELAA